MADANWRFHYWTEIAADFLNAIRERNMTRDEIDRHHDMFKLAKQQALLALRASASASE